MRAPVATECFPVTLRPPGASYDGPVCMLELRHDSCALLDGDQERILICIPFSSLSRWAEDQTEQTCILYVSRPLRYFVERGATGPKLREMLKACESTSQGSRIQLRLDRPSALCQALHSRCQVLAETANATDCVSPPAVKEQPAVVLTKAPGSPLQTSPAPQTVQRQVLVSSEYEKSSTSFAGAWFRLGSPALHSYGLCSACCTCSCVWPQTTSSFTECLFLIGLMFAADRDCAIVIPFADCMVQHYNRANDGKWSISSHTIWCCRQCCAKCGCDSKSEYSKFVTLTDGGNNGSCALCIRNAGQLSCAVKLIPTGCLYNFIPAHEPTATPDPRPCTSVNASI